MIIKLFSIYDCKTAVYSAVFPCISVEGGKRIFADLVGNADSLYGRHPADYTLFYVADSDDSTGKIIPRDAFDNLGNGLDFLSVK